MSPSEIQASPNANATLPCNVTFPPSVKGNEIDQSVIKVSWIRNGSDIASFSRAATKIKEGFTWDTREFVNGDFSLTILRAGLHLQGVYECKVSYNSTMLHSSNTTFSILGMSLFSCWDLTWAKDTFEPKSWIIFPSISSTSSLLSIPHTLGASAVGGVGDREPA